MGEIVRNASEIAARGVGNPRTPAPACAHDGFRLEPHVCRICHTRIVSRRNDAGGRAYECPNCGAHAEGTTAAVLCCCGMKVRRPNRNGLSGYRAVDAGIRCVKNPEITPEMPSLYVAIEVGANE